MALFYGLLTRPQGLLDAWGMRPKKKAKNWGGKWLSWRWVEALPWGNGNEAIAGRRKSKGEQHLPGVKDDDFNVGAKGFPEMMLTAELVAAVLVEGIGQFENLMTEEGEQGEEDHGEAQVLLAMTEIMLQVVALIFQGVEAFVFDFPVGTSGADEQFDIIRREELIGDPTIGIMNFFVAVEVNGDDPRAQEIGKEGVLGAIQGEMIEPLINMDTPLFVGDAPGLNLSGAGGDLGHQGFM